MPNTSLFSVLNANYMLYTMKGILHALSYLILMETCGVKHKNPHF